MSFQQAEIKLEGYRKGHWFPLPGEIKIENDRKASAKAIAAAGIRVCECGRLLKEDEVRATPHQTYIIYHRCVCSRWRNWFRRKAKEWGLS